MIPRRTDTLFGRGPIAASLIGVWTLRQYSDIRQGLPPQHPFGISPEGLLIYTPDGFVSAVLMAPNRPKLSGNGLSDGTSAEYTTDGRGFIGYSGVYDVDEALSVVTHRPLVAFAPNMIGSCQRRLVELNGDTLVLTANHAQPAGSGAAKSLLEWLRVKAGPAMEGL
jgi:Lipocalin-like domain